MYCVMVVVLFAGPPPVRRLTLSKIRKLSMVRSSAHYARLVFRLGIVTYHRVLNAPEPSTFAALY